ncbi:type II toxin-antitoxin system VapC family toxin [Archaeoglobus sp.]
MIFDASSIFVAVKNKKLRILKNVTTSSLVRYELGNVIWKEIYLHKTLNYEKGLKLLRLLMKVVEKVDISEPDYVETLKTACKYGITFYDAVYVQLAIDHSDVLVTEDKKLKRKIRKDVNVLSIDELDNFKSTNVE